MKWNLIFICAAFFMGHAALTAAPADLKPMPETRAKWVKQHSDECLRLAKIFKKKELMFLGDSITWGWRDITKNGGSKSWNKYFGRNSVNFGISGDRIEHVLWRITEGKQLDYCRFDIVVMMIGINNILGTKSTKQTIEDVAHGNKQIIDIIKAKQPQAKILLLSILPLRFDQGIRDKMAKDVNPLLKKLADNKKVFYLDLTKLFLDAKGNPIHLVDGLHPNAMGYQKMAPVIDAEIKKIKAVK